MGLWSGWLVILFQEPLWLQRGQHLTAGPEMQTSLCLCVATVLDSPLWISKRASKLLQGYVHTLKWVVRLGYCRAGGSSTEVADFQTIPLALWAGSGKHLIFLVLKVCLQQNPPKANKCFFPPLCSSERCLGWKHFRIAATIVVCLLKVVYFLWLLGHHGFLCLFHFCDSSSKRR